MKTFTTILFAIGALLLATSSFAVCETSTAEAARIVDKHGTALMEQLESHEAILFAAIESYRKCSDADSCRVIAEVVLEKLSDIEGFSYGYGIGVTLRECGSDSL